MSFGESADKQAEHIMIALSPISIADPIIAIIWHSRTGAAQAMAEAAWQGAQEEPSIAVKLISAAEATPEQLLAASAYIFVCPENLGTMSGMMKEMFDRAYYPLLGKVEGRPYATLISAGSDGSGAQRQLDRIVMGWRLRRVADPIIINLNAQIPEEICEDKLVLHADLLRCSALGASLAAGLALGIY